LADEPTAHLDFIQVEEVLRLIRELASVIGWSWSPPTTVDSAAGDRIVEMVPEFATMDRPPETVRLLAGETLFEQGTMGDLIYVVSEGDIEMIRELPAGGEELLKVAMVGDYFGEIAPLPHAASGDRAGAHRCDGRRLHRGRIPGAARCRRGARPHRAPPAAGD